VPRCKPQSIDSFHTPRPRVKTLCKTSFGYMDKNNQKIIAKYLSKPAGTSIGKENLLK